MSDEDLKAELERLRNENAALKEGVTKHSLEGQRERRSVGLRHGAVSRDLV